MTRIEVIVNIRKSLSLYLIFALILTMVACGNKKSADKVEETTTPEVTTDISTEGLQVTYPVTVTDQLGRQVTIEKEPSKIASGYYISSSILLALGEKDNFVAIEAKAKSRKLYSLVDSKLIDLPNVGTAKEFNLEACAAAAPEVVFVPARLKDTIPAIEALGMKVIAINPESQDLLYEAIDLMATVTNSMEKAEQIKAFTEAALTELTAALKDIAPLNIYLGGNSSILSTAGINMYQHFFIANTGNKNVAEALTDKYWSEVSYEKILAWNPDAIVIASDADYTINDVKAITELAQCNAIKNNMVIALPSYVESWDSPLPASFLGSLYIASELFPDKYSKETYEKKVVEFYNTFYSITPELK